MYVKRAYRFRFYPTPAQEPVLSQHFGCVRFVSNHMLARRQQRYRDKQTISFKDDSSALTLLKKDPAYAWLNDISSVALQQAV